MRSSIPTRLIEKSKINGTRVHDAKIAALCIHHGVRELLSADRDFSRWRRTAFIGPASQ